MDQAPLESAIEAAGEFARDVDQGRSEAERLDLAVELVVELIETCDHVGITAIGPNGVETVAASSGKTLQCDQLQYDLNEGPCLDTVRTHQTAISNDVARDRRWPTWGPAVAEQHGVGSMMSVLLYTHAESYGVLNLYSDQPQAYNSEDLLTAEALAAHLAVAASNGRELDHRGVAIVNRTMIGQAEGILMERYKVTAEQAFAMLREQSQRTNLKLARIAEDLTSTGKWERAPRGSGWPPGCGTQRAVTSGVMSTLTDVGARDSWRCWLCDEPVDPDASVNSDRGPSLDAGVAPKGKKALAGSERLAHRSCNTRKGAIKPVVAWSSSLFVVDPAPIVSTVERLTRKGGREVVARCLSRSDADDAAAWLVDRLSRFAPDLAVTTQIDAGGGQFLLTLRTA